MLLSKNCTNTTANDKYYTRKMPPGKFNANCQLVDQCASTHIVVHQSYATEEKIIF